MTPDSLYMFLNLLLGGHYLVEGYELDNEKEAKCHFTLVHITHDLVFTACEYKFLTPVHIGIATTLPKLHTQKSWWKCVINASKIASNIMSYHEVIKLDSGLVK